MEPIWAKVHRERMAAAVGVVAVAAVVAVAQVSATNPRRWLVRNRSNVTPPTTFPTTRITVTTPTISMALRHVPSLTTPLLSPPRTPRPTLRKRPAAAVIAETGEIATTVVDEETAEAVAVMIADQGFLADSP